MDEMKHILIVDDDPVLALEVSGSLWELGYAVVGIVATGESAIRNARESGPDLILTDIMLAGRMDGREAAMEIRKTHDTPVIFMTAFGDKRHSKSARLLAPEGLGYLVKPFTKCELGKEIERVLFPPVQTSSSHMNSLA